jgi:hypothetical protein
MSADELPGWRETTAKRSIAEFVAAVTDPGSPDFIPGPDRWIFSGGGTDFMRAWTADGYGLPPHRVIGSVGEIEFRVGDDGPELVKTAKVAIINDGPQKPSSIHRHVGQRPAVAAGNTDGDLAMLQWTAASPYRTLELVVHHTDGDREYAYDRDPILGSGTGQILAAAAEHKWTVIDMAADWATVHPDAQVSA